MIERCDFMSRYDEFVDFVTKKGWKYLGGVWRSSNGRPVDDYRMMVEVLRSVYGKLLIQIEESEYHKMLSFVQNKMFPDRHQYKTCASVEELAMQALTKMQYSVINGWIIRNRDNRKADPIDIRAKLGTYVSLYNQDSRLAQENKKYRRPFFTKISLDNWVDEYCDRMRISRNGEGKWN